MTDRLLCDGTSHLDLQKRCLMARKMGRPVLLGTLFVGLMLLALAAGVCRTFGRAAPFATGG